MCLRKTCEDFTNIEGTVQPSLMKQGTKMSFSKPFAKHPPHLSDQSETSFDYPIPEWNTMVDLYSRNMQERVLPEMGKTGCCYVVEGTRHQQVLPGLRDELIIDVESYHACRDSHF